MSWPHAASKGYYTRRRAPASPYLTYTGIRLIGTGRVLFAQTFLRFVPQSLYLSSCWNEATGNEVIMKTR